jgi:protein tyrosine phosphatase
LQVIFKFILVFYSAGVGRTGTFIAIYNICKSLGSINAHNKKLRSEAVSDLNVNLSNKKEEMDKMTDTVENLGNSNFNFQRNAASLPFFSVFNVVRKLREQRYGMVTDATQYKFIYTFVIEWLNRNFEY